MEAQPELTQVRARPQPAVPPASPYGDVARLLVVRDDRLGDVVLSLPAIARLKRAYPDAELGLLVQPSLASLASMFRPVDRVLETGDDLAAAVRDFAPDAAVCVSRRPGAAFALRRAGVRRVAGTGRRWFSFVFDRRVAGSRRRAIRHEVEHALDLAACAGASAGPVEFPIVVPDPALETVRRWLDAHGVGPRPLVLHPGTAGSCPGWPPERWQRLAERLRATGRPVVVTQGPADGAAMRAFATTNLPIFHRDLPELAALLQTAGLVASNSTGPIHLAGALGTPTLALHAPWNSCGAERWGPYRENGWALVIGSSRARGWSRRQRLQLAGGLMRRLSVEQVEAVVADLWAGKRPRIEPGAVD